MVTGNAANRLLQLSIFVVVLTYQIHDTLGKGSADDVITNLPGLTFNPGFKQYSGFLHTPSENNLFYWLVEAESNPSTAPLVLWLNGGPGCSSLGGLFTELGPFRVNQDGKTLFENVYSWNKAANVLFLESPYDVGFSFRDPNAKPDYGWSDTKTAIDNADALAAFFERFPQYQGRPFFITGESYAGVYLPTLASILIERIIAGTLIGVNFVGMAIGNGILSELDQFNSVIDLFYYRGILGMDEFDGMRNCCKEIGLQHKPLPYCNFSAFIDWNIDKPKRFNNTFLDQCAENIVDYYSKSFSGLDPYNTYQDCYMDQDSLSSQKFLKLSTSTRDILLRSGRILSRTPFRTSGARGFIDQGARINIGSTDSQYGFPCWMHEMTKNYLNLPEVRNALHVPSNVPAWSQCSRKVNRAYEREHLSMISVFDRIIESGFPLRILIYSGDADTVCNFLGNEWFIFDLAKKWNLSNDKRYSWTFQENRMFFKQLGGYRKNFTNCNAAMENLDACVTIDFVTIKGAGHFVPLDRGGPSLQMITNFIQNININTSLFWNITAKQILPQYIPFITIPESRKEADRITYLPGLTYTPKFKQYSGYLNGVPGDYLHYW